MEVRRGELQGLGLRFYGGEVWSLEFGVWKLGVWVVWYGVVEWSGVEWSGME